MLTTLNRVATCGSLSVKGAEFFAMGETVPVSGDVAKAADRDKIRATLEPLIGSRNLTVDVDVLNEDLCAIRNVLPPATSTDLSIWLGNGEDGSANLTGVYSTGQNPVTEIRMPTSIEDGYLWVMVVDNTGKVFHILPNINQTEHRLGALGVVEGGTRRVTVLHPISALRDNPKLLAMRVNAGDYGKSEVIAILTRAPLFDLRRPRDESVPSVAGALKEALAGRDGDVIGVAARVIDARP